jgi:hypothetical protein
MGKYAEDFLGTIHDLNGDHGRLRDRALLALAQSNLRTAGKAASVGRPPLLGTKDAPARMRRVESACHRGQIPARRPLRPQ